MDWEGGQAGGGNTNPTVKKKTPLPTTTRRGSQCTAYLKIR